MFYKIKPEIFKPQIIKLNERDYVNGYKVIGVSNISGWVDTPEDVIYKDHIKSIVTKEQYKQIEYIVE